MPTARTRIPLKLWIGIGLSMLWAINVFWRIHADAPKLTDIQIPVEVRALTETPEGGPTLLERWAGHQLHLTTWLLITTFSLIVFWALAYVVFYLMSAICAGWAAGIPPWQSLGTLGKIWRGFALFVAASTVLWAFMRLDRQHRVLAIPVDIGHLEFSDHDGEIIARGMLLVDGVPLFNIDTRTEFRDTELFCTETERVCQERGLVVYDGRITHQHLRRHKINVWNSRYIEYFDSVGCFTDYMTIDRYHGNVAGMRIWSSKEHPLMRKGECQQPPDSRQRIEMVDGVPIIETRRAALPAWPFSMLTSILRLDF